MKTALNHLIEILEKSIEQEVAVVRSDKGYNPEDVSTCVSTIAITRRAISKANELLELEKKHIMDGFADGFVEGYATGKSGEQKLFPEQYFNDIYKS